MSDENELGFKTMKIPRAPIGLQAPGRRFWKKVLTEYFIAEVHDLERLFQACRCLDEISESEKVVEREGRFVKDRFLQVREHAASKVIRENKILFCRILRELSLDFAAPDSRPPRQY